MSPFPGGSGFGCTGRNPTNNLRTRTKGVVCPKSLKQVHFEENLCYLAFTKTMESQKAELLRVAPGCQVPKPFFIGS
jgi:hypothetical protein